MDRQALINQLAKKVRILRIERGLTQQKLAHTIGKDQQAIQRLEKARINPTLTFLYALAEGLNVSINELLADPDK